MVVLWSRGGWEEPTRFCARKALFRHRTPGALLSAWLEAEGPAQQERSAQAESAWSAKLHVLLGKVNSQSSLSRVNGVWMEGHASQGAEASRTHSFKEALNL